MRRTKKLCYLAAALTMIILYSGCGHTPQYLTKNFGESYESAFSSQVINPEAPDDKKPVEALPGTIGTMIYQKRYVKSLTEEKKEEEEGVSRQLRDLK